MKLQAKIIESAIPKNGVEKQSIIIEFIDDKEKQHFEVFIENFDAYYLGIRKWDIWELSIKWKSEIFTDLKMLFITDNFINQHLNTVIFNKALLLKN